jgi:hypothetical protein
MRKQDLLPYFRSKDAILAMFPKQQHRGRQKRERHIYADNGAPILLVAHIDTVQAPRLDRVNRGAGFDDRLGVYLGHQLVWAYPHLFDLLLTDYEEQCASTAEYFTPSHDYNLIVGLDREGEDYVDYGLASQELRDALEQGGFTQEVGTFSDICFMDHIRANKINVGLGTQKGHSSHSSFDMGIFYRQVRRLIAFCELHRDTQWPKAVWPPEKYDIGLKPWAECAYCGDIADIDELVLASQYGGLLCASCHYILMGYRSCLV